MATTESELFGYGVLATFAQWLAAQQTPAGQCAATQRTEAHDGNPCIIGAAGMEAAALTQQGA